MPDVGVAEKMAYATLVGAALVTVRNRCTTGEAVSSCCDVHVQNHSRALKLRIYAAGGHLD